MEITPVATSSAMMMEEDNRGHDAVQHQHLYDHYHQARECGGGLDVDLCLDQLQTLLISEQSYLVPMVPCKYEQHEQEDVRDHHHVVIMTTTEDWRRKICQWSYRVVDNFRLDRSVVSMAMNLLDRFLILAHHQQEIEPVNSSMPFPQGPPQDDDDHDEDDTDDDEDDDMSTTCCGCLSCKRSVDSRTFQLASMTCLYISIKVCSDAEAETEDEVTRRKAFRLATFCDLSRGLFSAHDICNMEQEILTTLAWRVNPPSSMTFVPYLLLLLPPTQHLPTLESRATYPLVQHVLRELSRYLTELAVCLGSDLSLSYPPSQIAFCSILVSMNLLTQRALPLSVRKTFSQAAIMRLFTSSTCATTTTTTVAIQYLCSQLMNALWPEIILEDGGGAGAGADPNHPIAMAREYGLLDVSQICQYRVAQLAAHCFSNGDPSNNPQEATSSCSSCCRCGCNHNTAGGCSASSPPGSPRGVDLNKPIVSWPESPVSVIVPSTQAVSSNNTIMTSPSPSSSTTTS